MVWWSVETNYGIYATPRTDGSLILIVAITPLRNSAGGICLQTVVARSNLASEERCTM